MIPNPRTATPFDVLAWIDAAPSFADLATFHLRNDANGYELLLDSLREACDLISTVAPGSDDAADLHAWLTERSPEAARELAEELADVYRELAREEIDYATRA